MPDQPINRPKPAVLMILDGFGVAPDSEGNAITRAKMPNFHSYVAKYPAMTIRSSGEEVGLSWGEMGNSEVGHLSIGAGRVYYQMFPRINRAVDSGEFLDNPAFLKAVKHAKENDKALHLIGMVSAGRVHAMDSHCHVLLGLAQKHGLSKVFVHAILDGRDTVYNAGIDFMTSLVQRMAEFKVGRVASLSGRYFAMDRDNRWDRIEKAYNCMALGQGETAEDPLEAIKASYAKRMVSQSQLFKMVMLLSFLTSVPIACVN